MGTVSISVAIATVLFRTLPWATAPPVTCQSAHTLP